MRKFGVSAFDELNSRDSYNAQNLTFSRQTEELDAQLKIFQDRIAEFAKVHNDELKGNPDFRNKFMHMCTTIGIDPLTLFNKDRHLFTVNDFYYEVCVKVIQICRETKDMNGGIISFNELKTVYFEKMGVNDTDLEKSIKMIEDLDGGFEIFKIRGDLFLRSVPNELTGDQTKILEICSILGYASISILRANLKWSKLRSRAALDEMVANGLLWIDDQSGAEVLYWDPSWITKSN